MKHVQGDIFEVAAQNAWRRPTAIGHGVNARGAAGGLAKVVFDTYPKAQQAYLEAIRPHRTDASQRHPMLGKIQIVGCKNLEVINMWTQVEPGPDAREWAVMSCVHKALRYFPGDLVIPLIGGGIGGLDPDQLISDFNTYFSDRVTLVTLPD